MRISASGRAAAFPPPAAAVRCFPVAVGVVEAVADRAAAVVNGEAGAVAAEPVGDGAVEEAMAANASDGYENDAWVPNFVGICCWCCWNSSRGEHDEEVEEEQMDGIDNGGICAIPGVADICNCVFGAKKADGMPLLPLLLAFMKNVGGAAAVWA